MKRMMVLIWGEDDGLFAEAHDFEFTMAGWRGWWFICRGWGAVRNALVATSRARSTQNPNRIYEEHNTHTQYTMHNTQYTIQRGKVIWKYKYKIFQQILGTQWIAKSILTSVNAHITKMIIFNFSKWRSTSNERNGGLRKLNSVSPAPRFLFNLKDG